MAWDTYSTTTSQIDETTEIIYDALIWYAATPELVADQVATKRASFNAKSVNFPTYSNLTKISSALTEANEADSVQLADDIVQLTPAEYGNVITRTLLANVQAAGKVDTAAAFLIGRNLGDSMDGLAITALDAFGGTTIYPNAATAASNLSVGDVMDKIFAGRLYNKLARQNTPGLLGGMYIGIAHDDVLHDLRADTAIGGWTDVAKYADPQSVLRGEVGMFAGVRWLRSANATVTSNASGTIDAYKVNVVGYNALGYAESVRPTVKVTGPFDKLGRFLNIGWYGIFLYDTVDANNQVLGVCASSVGSN